MYRISKTVSAERELEDIYYYGLIQWGAAQADRYHEELTNAMDQLADNPKLGKAIDAVRSGYRALRVNRHTIYYRIEGHDIRIMRVRHERMDPDRYL